MTKTFLDFGINIGTKTGEEVKVVCPQCSKFRKKQSYPCLNVNTEKGLWHCWHCEWSGSLKAGEWKRPEIVRPYVKPTMPAPKPEAVDSIMEYFTERGISREVIDRNRITKGSIYFPQVEEERGCILFPYLRDDEIVNIKYRTRDKLFRMAAGAERVLYGLNDINPKALIWVEGEIDKLSVEMAGYLSCVSVPDGAPSPETRDYSNKFDYLNDKALEGVEQHFIAVDNDAAGMKLQEELIRRLGRDKCLIVTWPDGCKDANDVLLQHGAQVIDECLKNAKELPIVGTYQVADMVEELRKEYRHGAPKGVSTGWRDLDPLYRVLPGEWTLVTGMPGDGKSEWLDALSVNLAIREGWNFGIFSPENQPLTYHVAKIAEKYAGKPFNQGQHERMSEVEFDEAMMWVNEHYTFALPDYPTVDELLDIARQLVTRKGIRGFIMDPWNEINHSRVNGLTETEHISYCLTRIRSFARNTGTHVWVVAHPTKLQKDLSGKYPVPTPYDVSGSAHWRNKADNCVTVYRDKERNGEEVEIHIQKIRKKMNGRVGMAVLNWDKLTGQYRDCAPGYLPKSFMDKQAKRAKKEAAAA